jgi:hypothetical protein
VAIQELQGALRSPGLLRCARNDEWLAEQASLSVR